MDSVLTKLIKWIVYLVFEHQQSFTYASVRNRQEKEF